MQGTVDGFGYGVVTPVTSYLVACLGSALGLRCVVRSLRNQQSWKPGWLALGAATIGCGIWTMHFVAMVGFRIEGIQIDYDARLTALSLVAAIVVVGVGVFVVGYRGATTGTLTAAGIFTGLGVAAMHYLGMAALRLNGSLRYDTLPVVASVLIAVTAATAALWAAASYRGFLAALGASLLMGVALTGMHYTGMAALGVHLRGATDASHITGTYGDASPTSILLPMLIGPVVFLILAGVVVMFDPQLVLGDGDWSRTTPRRRRARATLPERPAPAPRTDSLFAPRDQRAGRHTTPRGR
ncbi:MHYT domain-containing protein [Streptomyces sp. NBC_00728]|jgi:MHYT domain (predicted integral membrane sensor domain)|uniref:MHYT domain-containing protein n=1 Tax=Streptomyces sp. NBC_00728 TaxID=2903676 RepID=UPI00386AF7B7